MVNCPVKERVWSWRESGRCGARVEEWIARVKGRKGPLRLVADDSELSKRLDNHRVPPVRSKLDEPRL